MLNKEYNKSLEDFDKRMTQLQNALTTTNWRDKCSNKVVTIDDKRTEVNEIMESMNSIPYVQASEINEDPSHISLNFPDNPIVVSVKKAVACAKPVKNCCQSYNKMLESKRKYEELNCYRPLIDFIQSVTICLEDDENHALLLQIDENNQVVKIDPIKNEIPF